MIVFELSLPPSKVLVSIFISKYRVERRDRVGPIGVVKQARLGKTTSVLSPQS